MSQAITLDTHLRGLVAAPGPFVSLYLDTQAASEDGPRGVDLRWRNLRDDAQRSGASEQALRALDDVVSGAHKKGDALVAFTSGEQLAWRRYLGRAIHDEITTGAVPRLLPFIDWQQDNPAYAVVLSDRIGAEIHVIRSDRPDEAIDVEGDVDPIRKVSPGGWSQRRYQNRAENTWEANARQVARALQRIVGAEEIALVVVTGDVRSVAFLQDHIGEEVRSLAYELPEAVEASLDDIQDALTKTVHAYVAHATEEILEKFHEERGQEDLAVEGVDATFRALSMAQVDTLLVSTDVPKRTAWFSASDLTQAASSKKALTDLGIQDAREGRVDDVMIRTALGTGARVRVIPTLSGDQGPADGVGAILRFTTQAGSS